jgi:hypothetical protein
VSSRITPPGHPTSRTTVTSAFAQAIRVTQGCALIQRHQARRPGTHGRVGVGVNQARQDKAARQEIGTGHRPVMD